MVDSRQKTSFERAAGNSAGPTINETTVPSFEKTATIDELKLISTDKGIILPVRAKPNSRKNQIRGTIDGELSVAVSTVAEKGKANQSLISLLAKTLKVSKSQIQLIGGPTNTRKKFLITGVELESLRNRLAKLRQS